MSSLPHTTEERRGHGRASFVYFTLLVLLLATVPRPALAALAENCREIELNGAAGLSSQDKLVLRIVDANDPTEVISESCEFTVRSNENAVALLRRLPGGWGDGTGGVYPGNATCETVCTAPDDSPELGNTCVTDTFCNGPSGGGVCGERPKKVCGNTVLTGRSCTIETKITQQKGKCTGNNVGKGCLDDGDCGMGGDCPINSDDGGLRSCDDAQEGETCLKKPAVLRVCCRETPLCSGKKLDDAAPGKVPISILTKVVPVPALMAPDGCLEPPVFCPLDLPDDSVEPRKIALDPIGGRSGPYRRQRECRAALQGAVGDVTSTTFDVLRACRARVMSGELPSGSCASVTPTSDPGGLVAAATAALQGAVNDDCAATGLSPSTFGYRACPPPCDGITLATCVAGMVGNNCQRDRECDTTPGSLDGVCGSWPTLASCALCQGAAAGVQAVTASFGSSGAGLPPVVQQCQNSLGDAIGLVLSADLRDVAKCQKNVDEFKVLLSEHTPKCKDADVKRKRAKVRATAAALVGGACTNAALAQLDSCATNLAGLRVCAPRIAARAVAAVIDAAAPEGRCGDGKVAFGEKCDDGNTVDGDGCDSNCKPTGCGNEVVTAGEECDDGNLQSGDGCGSGCHAEPITCTPQMCSQFTFDCSGLFPGDCVCLRTTEGPGVCANDFNCSTAPTCLTSADCGAGERCYLDTCCGPPPNGRCGPDRCGATP